MGPSIFAQAMGRLRRRARRVLTPCRATHRLRTAAERSTILLLTCALAFDSVMAPFAVHAQPFSDWPSYVKKDGEEITGECTITAPKKGELYRGGQKMTIDGTTLDAFCFESDHLHLADHNNYVWPAAGRYKFTAKERVDGGYFVLAHTQQAKPYNGVMVPGYPRQRVFAKRWEPTVDVHFQKTSTEDFATSVNPNYSLEGAEYSIKEADGGKQVATIATDAGGKAHTRLKLNKSYIAIETKAPKGFKLSKEPVAFRTQQHMGAIQLDDEPATFDLTLKKADSATGGAAQPGASLQGAVYTAVDSSGIQHEATSNAQGVLEFFDLALGEVRVTETRAPEGYLPDTATHTYKADGSGHADGAIELKPSEPLKEHVKAFDIELSKFKNDPSDEDGGVQLPAAGVRFEIVSNTTGKVVTTLTTDVYGFAKTNEGDWHGAGSRPEGVHGSIPYDRKGYTVREVAETVPEGYQRMDDFEILPDQQVDGLRLKYIIENATPAARLQIVKTDAESGARVPLAGFSFQLLDEHKRPIKQDCWYPNHVELDRFTTDETGAVTLPQTLIPGTYFIKEVATKPPYLLNGELVRVKLSGNGNPVSVASFANDKQTGSAAIQKTCPDGHGDMEKAFFAIKALEDIIAPDGTVQAVEGSFIDTVATDKHGYAKIDGLPLGKGKARYAFVECQAPAGHVLDTTPHEFEISYDKPHAHVDQPIEIENRPNKLIVHKTEAGSGKPLEGAEFGFAVFEESEPEPSMHRDDDWIQEIAKTDEKGLIEIDHLKPGYVAFRENDAPNGYIADSTVHVCHVGKDGLIDGEAEKRIDVENDFTKIDISKREVATEEELPGASLSIRDSKGNLIDAWVSEGAPHRIEKLEPGKYTLIEEMTPQEHEKIQDVDFTVEPTAEVQAVAMYNAPISITGQIDKRQEIANPLNADYRADDEDNGDKPGHEGPEYAYTVDFRSTSSTWCDEFTVTDELECVADGTAQLDAITTPIVRGDHNGLLNVWYRTNRTAPETDGGEQANATLDDGHVNPWLADPLTQEVLGKDGRAVDYCGWKLLKKDVPSDAARTFAVKDLELPEGEYVTGVRFEFGRVERGFTTRKGAWDRDGIKDLHDNIPSTDRKGLQPAKLHMRTTGAYTPDNDLKNGARIDAYRNGGGEGLEAHDSDWVQQRCKANPVTPAPAPLDQTGTGGIVGAAILCCLSAGIIYTISKPKRRHR